MFRTRSGVSSKKATGEGAQNILGDIIVLIALDLHLHIHVWVMSYILSLLIYLQKVAVIPEDLCE